VEIAIFENMDRAKLEEEVTDFLRTGHVKVFHVTQSQSETVDSMGPSIIISIFFESEV